MIFLDLPSNCILHIFSYLDPLDLSKAGEVCKQWKTLSDQEVLWKQLNLEFFNDQIAKPPEIGWKKWAIFSILDTGKVVKIDLQGFGRTPNYLHADNGTLYNYTLEGFMQKWDLTEKRFITETRLEKFEKCSSIKIELDKTCNKKYSLIDDDFKKVWNFTLKDAKEAIICATAIHNRVVTGSSNGNVRIWNVLNGRCIRSFSAGCALPVFAITATSDYKIITALRSGEIQMYEFISNSSIKSIISKIVNIFK